MNGRRVPRWKTSHGADTASKLDISPGTLRSHIRDMMDRFELGADGLREFARQEIGRAVLS
jgi:hypothetical protein